MYIYNLGTRFENIAEKYQKNIALTFEDDRNITYEKLNADANRFARYLLDRGIQPKDVIAISGIKSPDTYVAILACLKTGATYTIFDPESPPDRLKRILTTAAPKAAIMGDAHENNLSVFSDQSDFMIVKTSDGLNEKLSGFDAGNLSETQTVTGENPAYIMFTSGSTGFPKGAVMTHRNLLNFINWSQATYQITPDDVLTNVNPMFFDNSVFDFYSSVFTGATMVPFTPKTVTDPKALVELLDKKKCSTWFSVPTLLVFLQTMRALTKNNFTYIKRIIFGGEGYPKARLKQLFDLYKDRSVLFNVYGPTECTCICSTYRISEKDFDDLQGYPPLGTVIPNFSYLILDENNRKVPDNELGELCLLGPNVGKGYYGDPERTRQSFVQNPYNENFSEIMYKTGDLVQFNTKNKKLYIAGRADNQIKHMGYRIELEEIENAMCRIDKISQAAAIHGTIRGLSRIVAVVSSSHSLDPGAIIKKLKPILPNYMIPTDIHIIDQLPKNPNGKVDRRKLKESYLPESVK